MSDIKRPSARKFCRRLLLQTAFLSLTLSPFIPAYGAEEIAAFREQIVSFLDGEKKSEGEFTLNYNNIPAIEYLRFVSKITGTNFVFEEKDLQFPVTILSESPISRESVMSLLAQILRINGLMLIEDGKSVIVTKSGSTWQTSPMSTEDNTIGPIATRLFSVKNGSLPALTAIIKPMLSDKALLSAHEASRSLVITDIGSNLQQIGDLIHAIDSAESPIEVQMFEPKSVSADELRDLAKELLTPFIADNPMLLLVQEGSGRIFIVSTPLLADKAMRMMEDLDTPPIEGKGRHIAMRNTFIYKIASRSAPDILPALTQIKKELMSKANPPELLIDAIGSVKWIKSTNTLFFIATEEAAKKLEEILAALDTPLPNLDALQSGFRIYKITKASEEQIRNSLNQIAGDIAKWKEPDTELIDAIKTMRWIRETHSLFFAGNSRVLGQLNQLLPVLDVAPENSQVPLTQGPIKSQFKVFKPVNQKGDILYKKVKEIGSKLQGSNLSDPGFLSSIQSAQLVDGNLIATGDPTSLGLLSNLITTIDVPSIGPGNEQSQLFNLKHISASQLKATLKKFSLNMNNTGESEYFEAIDSVKIMSPTQISAKGTPAAIHDLTEAINKLDTEGSKNGLQMAVIKLDTIDAATLITQLDDLTNSSPAAEQSPLAEVIRSAKPVPGLNAIVIHGSPEAIQQLQLLIPIYDTKPDGPGSKSEIFSSISQKMMDQITLSESQLPANERAKLKYNESLKTLAASGNKNQIERVTAIIQKLQNQDPNGKGSYLYQLCNNVTRAQVEQVINKILVSQRKEKGDPTNADEVIRVLRSATWMGDKSVMFEGKQQTLRHVRDLLEKNLPSDSKCNSGDSGIFSQFVVYTIKSAIPAQELITKLNNFTETIFDTGVQDDALKMSARSITISPDGKELIIPGDPKETSRIVGYLAKYDTGDTGGLAVDGGIEFDIFKLQYQSGKDIIQSLQNIGRELASAASDANQSLVAGIAALQWIEATNSLVTIEKPETVARLRSLITKLDAPLRQVFIEVLVIETSLSNSQSFGLEWGSKGQVKNKFGWGTGNFIQQPDGSSVATGLQPIIGGVTAASGVKAITPSTSEFSLGVIGDIIFHKGKSFASLAALVHALQQDTDSTIVLNPKIIAQDTKSSTIFSGQNIPFVGSTIATAGASGTISNASVEYRDIGVNLTIKPLLGDDDIITLDIVNDISEQISPPVALTTGNTGTSGPSGITTSHTSMNTRVHVPDNHFLVLSGMIRDTKTHSKTGIPCLGGLPTIGAAFSKNDRLSSKSNVIIFVRPHIIHTYEEYKALTARQEEVYKESASLPVLKEEFDAGLEIVKTPENE